MTPETKVVKAKANLIWDSPFFGVLSAQLILVDATDDPDINTMATDGTHMFYDAAFVEKLTMPELQFVVMHEILHCAFQHHTRRQQRDPERWNIAADFAINYELREIEKSGAKPAIKMPVGGLYDEQYAGMSVEQIYNLLPEDAAKQLGISNGQDPGGCGRIMDAAKDAAGNEAAAADMDVRVRQAASAAAGSAKGIGNLPAGIWRIIDELTEPKVDWKQVLRRFIDESFTKDYSWMKPNRRFLSSGIILPSLIGDGINHVVIAVDTSGSIDRTILREFASEINGAFGDGLIDKITVVWTDTTVAHTQEFLAGDELTLEAAGGGGTAFSNAFKWIADNTDDAACVIFFTDLEVHDFGKEPSCPTIWAVHGSKKDFARVTANVPFGECVSLAA